MMPRELLSQFHITNIQLVNQARKEVYVRSAEDYFVGFSVSACNQVALSAAYGAAMAGVRFGQ